MSHASKFTIAVLVAVLVGNTSQTYAFDELADLKKAVRTLQEKVAVLEKQVLALQPLAEAYERQQRVVKEVQDIGGTPGPIESTGERVTAETRLKIGQLLQVKWGDEWWAARVLELVSDGQVRIHYIGWSSSYDEVVVRSRIQLDADALAKARKAVEAPVKIVSGKQGTNGPIASSGIAVGKTMPLKPGQAVQVEWGGEWWAGKILELLPDGRSKIHYVGWDSTWDEIVPRSRLQLYPKKGR